METRRVYVAGAVRTPIGNFGGALAASSAAHLGGVAAAAAIERSGVPRERVDELLMGHARQAGNGPNLARQVVRRAGLADAVPAFTIHKACASGMQAVVSAAQSIRLGDSDIAVAGGVEHMSSIPYLAMDVRWGKKLGDEPLLDAMYRDGYLCPLCNQLMGETSETLATEYSIPRQEQDRYALDSNARAARAWESGAFRDEVVPVEVGSGKRATSVETDEHFRPVPARIARAVTDRTKALILNSPNNPTGAVYDASVLREIDRVIPEPVLVISDEPYRPIFGGLKTANYSFNTAALSQARSRSFDEAL